MKRSALLLCGLWAVMSFTAAFATEQMALMTVDPNNFAPGANISTATTGAQFLALSVQPNPDPSIGGFIPLYRPVFAQPVAAGCTILGIPSVPCTLGGNLAFGYTPTTTPSTAPILWGDEREGSNCVLGGPCDPELSTIAPVLRVNFAVPTDFVSAIAGHVGFDGDAIEAFEAFDSTGQLLEGCFGPPISFPSGCSTDVISAGTPQFPVGWAQLRISRPTADISFVLIGGSGNFFPISQVQFDSPVSVQIAGLIKKVQSLGPGKALANDATLARAYYGAGDITSACLQLSGFETLVHSQSAKKIDNLTASQLLTTVTAIEAALGCSN